MKKKKNLSEIIVLSLIKALKYLFIFLIFFFIIYTIAYNCFVIFANKEYVQVGNTLIFNDRDNISMEEEIKKGDLLIVKKKKIQNIKIGDIIVYKNGKDDKNKDIIKIQRVQDIISENGDIFIKTKGDSNLYPNEEEIKENEIIGKIIIQIPILGLLRIWDITDDLHLLPFEGTIDWKYVIKKLKEYNYNGPVTLELCYRNDYLSMSLDDFYRKGYNVGEKLQELFEKM